MIQVKFQDWTCNINIGKYGNGDLALQLYGARNTKNELEPIATCTICVPNVKKGYVAIKNYSENEGMLEALIKANIIGLPEYTVKSGFIDVPICKLKLDEFITSVNDPDTCSKIIEYMEKTGWKKGK